MGTPPRRVVWWTNFDAPYRRPVWSALARSVRLEVVLLDAGDHASLRHGNRGSDWRPGDRPRAYAVRKADTVAVRRGESAYYFPGIGFLRRARRADAYVLGGWESPAYWLAAVAGRLRGARLVGFYESHLGSRRLRSPLVSAVRAIWFRRLHAVVVPGTASRDALIADGVPADRIFTGFNAVDVGFFAAEAARLRAAGGTGHRFLYVGQLIPRKNVALAIRALESLPAESTLTIAGVGRDEAALRRLAAARGVERRVTFAGYVPHDRLPELYARHDTLVLPSALEVWGLVVNEALAAGLHVVVSETAGVAPSVRGMRGVWTVAPTEDGVAGAMEASARDYAGPIVEPEILAYTPERFARVFEQALALGEAE